MSAKNMTLWFERFNLLEEYVREFNKLPVATTEYRGFKIGQWLRNQRVSFKNGELTEEYSQVLFNAYPFWCSSSNDIREGNKNLLINSNWKVNVSEGHTPIDTVANGDRLYDYLANNIFDLECLLELVAEGKIKLNINEYYEYLSKVIPIIHPKYAMMARALSGEQYIAPLDSMKEFFYSLFISSAEDMQNKMNKMIEFLTKQQMKILKMRFALDTDAENIMSYHQIANILNLSVETVRMTEMRALRNLKHLKKLNVILKAGNDLDYLELDKRTKADLYRQGINSKEELIEKIRNNEITIESRESLKEFIRKENERKEKLLNIENILNEEISFLELSVRTYNCLRRSGYNLVRDVVKAYQVKGNFMEIRNMGAKSNAELENKLKELEITDVVIEDIQIEEEKPKTSTSSISLNKHYINSSKDTFNINTLDKRLQSDISTRQVISKLEDILNGKCTYNTIRCIEENCKYIQINDDAALSKLVSYAMSFVRDPKAITNTDLLFRLQITLQHVNV